MRACMCVCVYVLGWVRNCTTQVICKVVQTSIYAVTGVLTLGYTLGTILSAGCTHALVYAQVFFTTYMRG